MYIIYYNSDFALVTVASEYNIPVWKNILHIQLTVWEMLGNVWECLRKRNVWEMLGNVWEMLGNVGECLKVFKWLLKIFLV